MSDGMRAVWDDNCDLRTGDIDIGYRWVCFRYSGKWCGVVVPYIPSMPDDSMRDNVVDEKKPGVGSNADRSNMQEAGGMAKKAEVDYHAEDRSNT